MLRDHVCEGLLCWTERSIHTGSSAGQSWVSTRVLQEQQEARNARVALLRGDKGGSHCCMEKDRSGEEKWGDQKWRGSDFTGNLLIDQVHRVGGRG